jgi:hypothetical protein
VYDAAYKFTGADTVVNGLVNQFKTTTHSLGRNLATVADLDSIGTARWNQALGGAAWDAANLATFWAADDIYYGAKEGDWLRVASGAVQVASMFGGPTTAILGNVLDLGMAGRGA